MSLQLLLETLPIIMIMMASLESTALKKHLMMIQFLNNRNKQLCNQNLIRLKPSNWARKSCPSFEGEASSRTPFLVRQEFDAAIREVLRKWVSEDSEVTHSEDFLGLSHSDILDRYRQLRSRELKEETQVFIVTSDNTSYKIVLDVQDFMNGDLKVKVAGETEVVVEGRVERREEGSSSVSSYSFRRRFSLPEDIDMTAITCIMSSDGILTIFASKMTYTSTRSDSVNHFIRISE
nr:alpha-crystallin A chain-like [Penaeus vannamei]